MLDVVAITIADHAVTEETVVERRGAAAEALDARRVMWNPELFYLQKFVERLWDGSVGASTGLAPTWPATVSDLLSAHILHVPNEHYDAEFVCRLIKARAPSMGSEFLLSMRRAGQLKVAVKPMGEGVDKMSFNFYWVTKMFQINAACGAMGLHATHGSRFTDKGVLGVSDEMATPQAGVACSPAPFAIQVQLVDDAQSCVTGATLVLTLDASIIDMPAAEIRAALEPALAKKNFNRILVLLPPANAELAGRVLPRCDGAFKWHRKWELLIQHMIASVPVAAVAFGPTCPPLRELFFGANARAWLLRDDVNMRGYVPGPTAMQHLSHSGTSTLRTLLLDGLPLDHAVALGVVSAHSLEGDGPRNDATVSSAPAMVQRHAALLLEADEAWIRREVPPQTSTSPGNISSSSPNFAMKLGESCPAKSLDTLDTDSTDNDSGGLSSDSNSTPSRPSSLAQSDVLSLLQAIPACNAPLGYVSTPTSLTMPSIAWKDTSARCACVIGLGLSLPSEAHQYTQKEVCEMLGLKGSLASIYDADHIQHRTLAEMAEAVNAVKVSGKPIGQGALTKRHLKWARALLSSAITSACEDAGRSIGDIRCLSVCSSTGYLLPGLTAYVVKDLGLSREICRLDVVGMGCHAGLNAVHAAADWACCNPGELAIACGVEVCSAHYIWRDSAGSERVTAEDINHAVVNSLFGDGCFATALEAPRGSIGDGHYAALRTFSSLTATEAIETMDYRYDEAASQFWFHLDELAPYAVGSALSELRGNLQRKGSPIDACRHFVVHTGGQTVIDSVVASLGLDLAELGPTVRTLMKYGNQSSASFMFAFAEFLQLPPSDVDVGDIGAFITMGPGAGVECCLWSAGQRAVNKSCLPLEGWLPAALNAVEHKSFVQRIADPTSVNIG